MGRRRDARGATAALLFVLILALGSILTGSARPNLSPNSGLTAFIPAASGGPIRAYVTWDGTNVTSATTASSALSTNFASTITLVYHWSSTSDYTVSDARLQMFYFGYALSTRDVVDSNPQPTNNGTFTMAWQAGALDYLLEGTFRLTVSLLTPTSTALWSQDFYVHAAAPLNVLAAIPIILVLIVVYETYGLLTSGREPAPPKEPRPTAPAPSTADSKAKSPDPKVEEAES
jgi:hypothetical protein